MQHELWRWLWRTPVQTFVLCPLLVIAFEFAWRRGQLTIVPWGLPLLAWGYLQYRFVGSFRLPRAAAPPAWRCRRSASSRSGPYRYTRNPMYLGHLIFLTGLAITFWSWFALIILAARACWFQQPRAA